MKAMGAVVTCNRQMPYRVYRSHFHFNPVAPILPMKKERKERENNTPLKNTNRL